MRQVTFNWKPQSEFATYDEFKAQPSVIDADEFRKNEPLLAHDVKYRGYTRVNLDDVRIEMREVQIKTENLLTDNRYICGVQYTFDVRAIIIENATERVVCGEGSHGDFRWDDEKHAQRQIKKWKQAIIDAKADAALLASIEPATRATAFFTKEQVAALPVANADTKVGDLVAVRGFGKNRAGYVIEVTPKRVRCVLRTVESTKREGDNGYIKWFKLGQDARL